MPDYSKGKIYKLCSNQTDKVYIGSTVQELEERLRKHQVHYKRFLENKTCYISSFEIVKYEDVYIELIEEYPCNSKEELEKQEGQIIKNTNNYVNNRIAGRSLAEFYQDNKEQIKNRIKNYYENNKDIISVKNKLYRNKNKEHIKTRNKLYRQNNKDKLKELASSIIVCECGAEISRSNISQHKKTTKHLDRMKNINSDACATESTVTPLAFT